MRKYIRNKTRLRSTRAVRVRKKTQGTATVPRMCVVKTNSHLYAQVIDDVNGQTLGSVSTLAKEFRGTENGKKNKASAAAMGGKIAEICKDLNISKVRFDRGHSRYHGTVAAFADAARDGGLEF